jgi:hypothetical protein
MSFLEPLLPQTTNKTARPSTVAPIFASNTRPRRYRMTTPAQASTKTGTATQLLERNLFSIDQKPYATAFIDGAAVGGGNRHVPSSASPNTWNNQVV